MKLKLRYEPFTQTMTQAIQIGSTMLQQRSGFYIRLYDENNDLFGSGEACPLESLSKESLPDIKHELQQLSTIEINHKLSNIPVFSKQSSLQWAIESAYLDGLIDSNNAIAIQPLFMSLEEAIKASIMPQHATIKVKIGRLDISLEKQLLEKLLKKHPQLNLRLDANKAFTLKEALSLFDNIESSRIDYIEDPCKSRHDYDSFTEQCGVPYALEAHELSSNEAIHENCKAIIYKPTLNSGLKKLYSLRQTYKHLSLILSSCFETKIGLNAISKIASIIAPNTVHGFGTASYLYDEPIQDYWIYHD